MKPYIILALLVKASIFQQQKNQMRLCDEQGRSLLNIIDGIIFGEIEILDQVNRKKVILH
ncbi:unnamed protein product [Paramecium primaurelia]|uniref:Uncharacterized protein n=1 Tax=Paramecium primaurelia TaxID=5886 RepID=A0A8S1LCW3_PARPR|nr:unnamed protein product [Paramecium primaurelia]